MQGHLTLERLFLLELFPPAALVGQGVAHGYKGKVTTTHLIEDAVGRPLATTATAANVDDRGYTSRPLRKMIARREIYPANFQRGQPMLSQASGSF